MRSDSPRFGCRRLGPWRAACGGLQGSCNIDINFPFLFLDGNRRASGMQINNVMGVTIGPGGYFLNFTQYGLQINAGHEVMMDRVWLGETNFDFNHEQARRRGPPTLRCRRMHCGSNKVGYAAHS